MEKEKNIGINDFALLLLGTLASKSTTKDSKNQKVISLPIQYKQIIENILCTDTLYQEKIAYLINLKDYFDDHFFWEQKLSSALQQILKNFNKTVTYNFDYDTLLISFTKNEIEAILSKYTLEQKDIMHYFTSLLNDPIYSRNYQETVHDYYASTVKKMHELYVSEMHRCFKRKLFKAKKNNH